MEQTALIRAFEHFKAGRLEPAAELLRAFLSAAPFEAPANHLLGGIYYRQGKHGAACEHLGRHAPGQVPRPKCSTIMAPR
jgi:TolA-binding protein